MAERLSNGSLKVIPILAIVISLISLGYAFTKSGSQGPAGPAGPTGPAGPEGPPGTVNDTAVEALIDERVAFEIPHSINATRGCTGCHTLIDPSTGRYTLSYEAHNAVSSHPSTAPGGIDISPTSTAGLSACLTCHASDGPMAGISMMDIVHPVHMFSQIFKYEFGGNCFSCHNVDSDGVFEVLPDEVSVSSKGVPETIPLPGAYKP